MFWEGLRAILRARRGMSVPMRRSGSHGWIHGLPLKMRFKRSKIYLSVIPVSSSASSSASSARSWASAAASSWSRS